ncbi:MAG: hypothetical protein ACQEXV_21410 [Bacillota bacterium]
MKNMLIGNGITIQFGGSEYLNSNILRRAIENIRQGNYPKEIYPKELEMWFPVLFEELKLILIGEYDKYVVTQSDIQILSDLKLRYRKIKRNDTYDSIGFEDYFFVHNLVCLKTGTKNPDKFNTREGLRVCLLDSIYNQGKILEIYKNYPDKLKPFLMEFDKIFTTNYDNNIESFLGKEVYYLHGAFHILQEVYDPESFRNQLSDRPIEGANFISEYIHLYSNALTSYSGSIKGLVMTMNVSANESVTKLAEGYTTRPDIADEIEKWKDSDSALVRNLYEATKLKTKNANLKFSEYYPLKDFSSIQDSITIIGLSPNNDSHIIDAVNNNNELSEITYYYYDRSEANRVRNLFSKKKVITLSVRDLWNSLK